MRFLVLNTDYPMFLQDLYASQPGLEHRPFVQQMQARMDTLFAVADFYSNALRELGHEAWDVYGNNPFAQKAWAREQGISFTTELRAGQKPFPWACRQDYGDWILQILEAQIRYYRPDVLLNQAMNGVETDFLWRIKPCVGCLVGQHAATQLKDDRDWSVYDLAISSFMPTVQWFRERGVPAKLNRLGFDPGVLARLTSVERDIPVSFVGSFAEVHSSRTVLLEEMARRLPLQVWGAAPKDGFGHSPLGSCYRGPAWGVDMFRILARSRIAINHHGNVPPYANNLRLFESTGVGTLLVTDWKPNLDEMFTSPDEVIAYRSTDECIDQVQYYLEHDHERMQTASAGQRRTLQNHTFVHRMRELVELVGQYV